MSLPLSDLRKGDRVVISRSSHYYGISNSNPKDDVIGTVQADRSGSVKWDNGTTNGYSSGDLVRVSANKARSLKEGDNVLIDKSSRHYDLSNSKTGSNPPDTIGRIKTITASTSYNISVEWNNGTFNTYSAEDLILSTSTSTVTSSSSELTKSPIVGKWYINPGWSRGSMAKFRNIISGEFGYSDRIYLGDSSSTKTIGSWGLGSGVRLATEEELRKLPKNHCDHPDYDTSSSPYEKGVWYTASGWRRGSVAKATGPYSTTYFHFEQAFIEGSSKSSASRWSTTPGIRKATISELSNWLPKDHPDNPSKVIYTPKTGDKVKVVANRSGSCNQIGDIGIVGMIYGSNCEVKVGTRSGGNCHYFDDLELVSTFAVPTYKPQKGDKVKLIANRAKSGMTIGAIGIVSTMYSDHCCIQVEGRGSYYNYFDDLEFVSGPTKSTPSTSKFKVGDTVKITANTNSSVNRVGDIGITKKYETSSDTWKVLVPGRPDLSNWTRADEMVLHTDSKTPSITSAFWRIKTQKEMINDGTIPPGCKRPITWGSQMDKHFGETIPSKFYPAIERMGEGGSVDLWDDFCYRKFHFTTNLTPVSIPWETDDDDDEEDETSSWDSDVKDGSYDSDLDRLDAISGESARFIGMDFGAKETSSKRPKKEVEIIPQKKRMIY